LCCHPTATKRKDPADLSCYSPVIGNKVPNTRRFARKPARGPYASDVMTES